MKRGDLVTIAVTGDYGKPRPALVIQSDSFSDLTSVTVLRLTSELHDWPAFRVTVHPSDENGLRTPSQVMIDRAVAIPREKIGPVFGHVDMGTMRVIGRALLRFLDLESAQAL